MMRLGFSWTWNYATSLNLPMPAFDAALKESP